MVSQSQQGARDISLGIKSAYEPTTLILKICELHDTPYPSEEERRVCVHPNHSTRREGVADTTMSVHGSVAFWASFDCLKISDRNLIGEILPAFPCVRQACSPFSCILGNVHLPELLQLFLRRIWGLYRPNLLCPLRKNSLFLIKNSFEETVESIDQSYCSCCLYT